MTRPLLLHRTYDLHSGGAEAVICTMAECLPEFDHHIVFNRLRRTWVYDTLCASPYVRLERTSGRSLGASAERAVRVFMHLYPPMSAADLAPLSTAVLKKVVVYNHWNTTAPFIAGVSDYWFVSPDSFQRTGLHIPPSLARVVLNPVAKRYFSIARSTRPGFRVGRHSRDAIEKFSDDFWLLHDAIDGDVEVSILGAPAGLRRECERRQDAAARQRAPYEMLPMNSVPVADFLSDLDVYVYKTHDSFAESCSVSILEALAAGLPVVCEEKGGNKDLVEHGRTGFLCSRNTDFPQAISQLRRDPALRARMGAAARAWAKEHVSPSVYRAGILRLLALAPPGSSGALALHDAEPE